MWVLFIVLTLSEYFYFFVPEIGENASDARRDEHTN